MVGPGESNRCSVLKYIREMVQDHIFEKKIVINSPTSEVWRALTEPAVMNRWMSETELEIVTDWRVGGPIMISGALYKKLFENRGIVSVFDVERELEYSHLSSLSRLEDRVENYCVINFCLEADGAQTLLLLTIRNFPMETIYKHMAFYWGVAVELMRREVEG